MSMSDQGILINTLVLQEAKDSSEIESIVTTHDDSFAKSHASSQALAAGRRRRRCRAMPRRRASASTRYASGGC